MNSQANKYVLQSLVAVIFIVLFLPGIQKWTEFIEVKPLDGYTPKVPNNPQLSDTGWFNSSYQKQKAGWLNENYGFRNVLMRLHNQIGYSFWNHSYTNAVIVGKDSYLFDMKYIRAWQGKDFIGSEEISDRVLKLKVLKEELENQGKTVLVVMAPGKASFFHAYLPEEEQIVPDTSNYEVYCRYLKQSSVPFIDVASWFDVLRNQTEYPLFPKCGIHWSTYGATVAADSITARIAQERRTVLPRIIIDQIIFKDTANEIDGDIGIGMNLLYPPQGFPLAYPQYHFSNNASPNLPSALVIGDSYYWTHNPWKFYQTVYSQIDFYYYNRDWHPFNGSMTAVDITQAWSQCLSHDVVLFYCVDANLPDLGWGFIEQAYSQMQEQIRTGKYTPAPKPVFNAVAPTHTISSADIAFKMQAIRNDKNWYALIIEKANKEKMPVDSMLYRDAIYIIEQERKSKR